MLYQLGENQLHNPHRAARGGGCCSVWGTCAGPKVVHSAKMPSGVERVRGTFPYPGHLVLTRRFIQDTATAQGGYFLLSCPSRGISFFYSAQRCHAGEQDPRWSGRFEGWWDGACLGPSHARLFLDPHTACDDHSLHTLPCRALYGPLYWWASSMRTGRWGSARPVIGAQGMNESATSLSCSVGQQ